MRRLLRDSKTRRYFANDGGWTNQLGAAYNFSDVLSLIHHALALEQSELEQVLIFFSRPSRYDMVIPIKHAG